MRLCQRLGGAEFADVGAAGETLPGTHQHDPLDSAVRLRALQ